MAEFTGYAPGTFCWIETGSSDPDASRSFYTSLFGWQADDLPPAAGGPYTMFRKDGKPVAGMYALSGAQQAMGIPSHWASYVSVTDVESVMAGAAGAGGAPMGEVTEVPGMGKAGFFADPTGAMVGVWEPQGHFGAALANEPGTLIWNELLTNDPATAAAFYCNVFGWSHETREMPTGEYGLFRDGEEYRAGMLRLTPEMGGAPPSWTVYLAVDDLDASTARASELGGTVEGPVIETGGVGRMAVLRDPAGAYLMLMEPAESQE